MIVNFSPKRHNLLFYFDDLGLFMIKSFRVYGQVQGVMFRQTFIRGLIKRKLNGGATNNKDAHKTVSITIETSEEIEIDYIVQELIRLKVINSWNATIEKIEDLPVIKIEDHEVTTSNVDDHQWSSGVEFYF